MIRITVLFFAALRNLFEKERIAFSLPEGSTLKVLLEELFRGKTNAQRNLMSVLFAVNHEYAGEGTVLQDGDEVALLPPMSGG